MTTTQKSPVEDFDLARTPYPLSFNEYSDPRTVPPGWDPSEVMAPPRPNVNGRPRHTAPSSQSNKPEPGSKEPTTAKEETGEKLQEWHHSRFLEPNSNSDYWDQCW